MNQIIMDNRHKIDTACQSCFYTLDKYHKAVNAFNEEKRRIAALPYVQAEQEKMVNRAADTLKNSAQSYYGEIKRNLDTIRAAVGEMENLMDIGEDLQNTLSVVKALGSAMPEDTRRRLVEQFKGQYQSLAILKAAYEAAKLPAEHYFKGLLFSSTGDLDELDNIAYRLVMQPGTDMLTPVNFGNKLEKFAVSLGVELTLKYRDIVDISNAINGQIRVAAGLGAVD